MSASPAPHPVRGVVLLVAALALLAFAPAAAAAPAAPAPAPAPAAAPAQAGLDEVARSLRENPVYVHPQARDQLPADEAAALEERIEDADKPVFVAVLPDTEAFPEESVLPDLRTLTGVSGVYAVRLGDGFDAGADPAVLPTEAVDNLVGAVQRTAGDDAGEQLGLFVDQALPQAEGRAPASWNDGGGDGSPLPGLLILGGLLVAGGALVFAARRRATTRRRERERAELEKLRVVVDEDITAFGEELDRHDLDPAAPGTTEAMREDYTRALDCYDAAKRKMADARHPADVRPVTETLGEGRFALAVLAARRAGRPLPEARPPCFFDPRHGPSVTDVHWAPPGGTARDVPACQADADRLARGDEPEARMVDTEHGARPYWNAGPAYAPWAGGYFAGGILPGMLVGTMLGSMMMAPGAYAATGEAAAAGGDYTGSDFDGGGFGGDFGGGGGDLGGGGFGGGDFGGF
ncbi:MULTISPECIES: hypothetical protein [Streptomyces]|uniref:hypothetical protein n=1 Tax=Streptomyces TaxID=1883 RepID=UPI0022490657|nr:hypothetical protein [Streptomyces sp. JHD 1]MCX2968092.1 hypothetical protein [Streptomyces sp. JHD 1]